MKIINLTLCALFALLLSGCAIKNNDNIGIYSSVVIGNITVIYTEYVDKFAKKDGISVREAQAKVGDLLMATVKAGMSTKDLQGIIIHRLYWQNNSIVVLGIMSGDKFYRLNMAAESPSPPKPLADFLSALYEKSIQARFNSNEPGGELLFIK